MAVRVFSLPFLLRRLEGVEEELAVVFGADESRVAVLFEEEVVDVFGGPVEGEPRRPAHFLLDAVHRPAVDVDLARRSRRQKLPGKKQPVRSSRAVPEDDRVA